MTAMLSVVEPMAPTLARQPFSNPDWLFEPKWDGFRATWFLQDGALRFVSGNRESLTERFPDLQRLHTATTAILDGEIVALDQATKPERRALMAFAPAKVQATV